MNKSARSQSASRRLQHLIEFVLFQMASGILCLLPLPTVRRIGAWLGEFAYEAIGFRRSTVFENLRYAFPEKRMDELSGLARASFRQVATSLVELLWFPRLTPERLLSIVRFSDAELFLRSHQRGRGIVLVTAHFGNWEIVSPGLLLHTKIPVHILYKEQSNRRIDGKIAMRRTRFGNPIVPLGLAVREIIRALRQGDAVILAGDQSAPKESIRLDFFGRTVPVFQGPAAFCLKTGASLISVFAIRQEDGTFRLQCEEVPSRDLRDTESGIRELTRRHLEITEHVIRRHPEQWMWMHRRWKHVEDERPQ